jgi:hypothetical protein
MVKSKLGNTCANAKFVLSFEPFACVLKSTGSSWHAEPILMYGFMKQAVHDDGFDYYEMLIIYVDNILSISLKAKERIDKITMHYTAKKGSIKEPTLYLGTHVGKMQLEDGYKVW